MFLTFCLFREHLVLGLHCEAEHITYTWFLSHAGCVCWCHFFAISLGFATWSQNSLQELAAQNFQVCLDPKVIESCHLMCHFLGVTPTAHCGASNWVCVGLHHGTPSEAMADLWKPEVVIPQSCHSHFQSHLYKWAHIFHRFENTWMLTFPNWALVGSGESFEFCRGCVWALPILWYRLPAPEMNILKRLHFSPLRSLGLYCQMLLSAMQCYLHPSCSLDCCQWGGYLGVWSMLRRGAKQWSVTSCPSLSGQQVSLPHA